MKRFDSIDEFREGAGYTIDGIWYPRVTSILSIKSKPALLAYYGAMPSYRAGLEATERSAQEGTLVHETVETILRKGNVSIPNIITPSIDAFCEFSRNNDINPILIEERIVSRNHKYAGTIDVLAEVNGVIGVLDIKTSGAIYRDYGMQTAAYIEAFKENPDIPPLTSWVLRLDQAQICHDCGAKLRQKGGNTKVRGGVYRCKHSWSEMQGIYEFQEMNNFESNLKAFLAAKELWQWENEEYLKRI